MTPSAFKTTTSPRTVSLSRLFADHSRQWRDFTYIYPVISRRSRGLSLGVNVNVNHQCTFDCVYCSVDTDTPPAENKVDLNRLQSELSQLIEQVQSGAFWDDPSFRDTPEKYRRLNDIAFSGDGEPTLYPQLDQAVERIAQVKKAYQLDDVKIVLVTNATGLGRLPAQRALATLDREQGEVWAKLDAGTQAYYQQINRSAIDFKHVLRNILKCGQQRPIVIQTMFLRWQDTMVPREELEAYTHRLADLLLRGCMIDRVQLYTVARHTRETAAKPIGNAQLDRLADLVRKHLPMLNVEVFYKNG